MMTMETVSKVIAKLGAADIDGQLEVALVDGICLHSKNKIVKARLCWMALEL